jgi:hypothetical protein
MRGIKLVAALLAVSVGFSAFAEPSCTTESKDKWMSEEAFRKQMIDDGYTIRKFKVTRGNCYEIYGTNKEGKKVEIYSDPVTGKSVESK